MNCAPVVMVKNEARFIAQVLRPLVAVFADVYVGDTGSTDGTAEIAEALPNVRLTRYGGLPPDAVGKLRERLGMQAKEDGYEWAFLVDGDELYSQEAVMAISETNVPPDVLQVFTLLRSIDEPEPGVFTELDDKYSRFALYKADEAWSGTYPFEWPVSWSWVSEAKHRLYLEPPASLSVHGIHLHRLQRSPEDANVYRRQEKQFQFAMQDVDIPTIGPLGEPWQSLLR